MSSLLRQALSRNQGVSKSGFRYRGTEVSRLENMTDAVFGFSITLLVIASEVPKSYVELQASMYDFVGFLFCAFLLLGIWNNHKNFFLYYGLKDGFIQTLNFIFLFVLLFYIYPLKYLFSYVGSGLFIALLKQFNFTSDAMELAIERISISNMGIDQWADLLIRFGLGLVLIYFIFMLMHLNAYRKRRDLKLNAIEMYETKTLIYSFLCLILISMTSIAVVVIGGGIYSPHAGFVYLSIPIILPILQTIRSRKYK